MLDAAARGIGRSARIDDDERLALLAGAGPLSPSALAERAHLDRAMTSRAITTLVSKGLAERITQPGDARRAQVRLGAAGRQLYDEIFPQVAAMNAGVVAALDDTTVQALDRALEQLTAQATRLNRELAQDVGAHRRKGGSRRHVMQRDP